MMIAFRPGRKASAAFLGLMVLATSLLAPIGAAAQGVRIIRDAEIENIIRAYATPLFQAAGLNPRTIRVYLIDDDSLNAFVTGGMRMFIHTGLLMRTEDPHPGRMDRTGALRRLFRRPAGDGLNRQHGIANFDS